MPNSLDFREKLLLDSDIKQSGYDVISQFNGKICYINVKDKLVERLDWNLEDIAVTIVRTGNKIKTHEHLKNVKLTDLSELELISSETVKSFKKREKTSFFDGVNLYYQELINLNLICQDSRLLVAKIKRETTWFHAAKACGAAGADTILVIHDLKDAKKTKKYFQASNLEVIFSGNQFSAGMKKDLDSSANNEADI